MSGIVGQVARAVLTLVLGVALGFFVPVSAFADGTWGERRVTIGALLLLYGLAGAALGFRASTWYGLGLAVPGVLALSLVAPLGEGYGWYVLYAALIVALAVGGAYSTRRRPASGPAVRRRPPTARRA